MITAELALDAKAELGEGALWHDGRLLWVDIEGCAVNRFDPVSGRNERWAIGQRVGTVVPRRVGGLVLAVHRGIGILDTETGRFELRCDPAGGREELRFNDGKCDPRGRLFAGTMGMTKPRVPGTLYRIEPDFSFAPVLEGTGTSNGLAWSADESTLYYIDTPTLAVSAFDYDPDTGAISNRREVVKFSGDEGRPDGMTIDADGNLWVALWGGSGVVCCDPRTGRVLEKVEVPALQTTACAFGGPELRDLYITSARIGLDEAALAERPFSGGIFVARPGVAGVPAFTFAG
ncbi:MAG: SMP-30/gluconolactonase/LRE family protein [Verrucomicrobia bacterium]|nr:MAG: SMP-30/gluconolactonase/LRE family protein [Verrucomicrobiota bacterium]